MTLLICVFAAIIATVKWYKDAPEGSMKLGILCWMYWGASIMWLVDAIFEYAELKAEYFTPAGAAADQGSQGRGEGRADPQKGIGRALQGGCIGRRCGRFH